MCSSLFLFYKGDNMEIMNKTDRMQGIFRNILTVIGNNNEYQPCEDGLAYLMKMKDEGVSKNELHENVLDLIAVSGNVMRYAVKQEDFNLAEKLRELIFKMYVFDAQDWFDSFMIALEYDRKPRERFYIPRKKILKGHVETLQKLADGDIQELFLSQPPRSGKTTLIIFFITWLMGKYPQFPNLYVSYSAILTGKFYDGVQEILQDPHTYNWQKIFPDRILPNTNNGLSNAKDQTLSVDTKRHYPTLTCRSLYGTLNGACDVEGGILISDDLLSGIEEALNPDRLETAWGKVDNNMLSRAKQSTRILWIGTRWSTKDPIGRRMELLKTNDKFKNHKWADISIPALDENDESNFEYDYGVGFSTEAYQQKRASFEQNGDIESWLAQYQQQPIDREGTVFNPNDMQFFDGTLPNLPCDWAFTTVDPAFGGGDFVAGPLCKAYGDKVYVVDVIYTNEDKTISQPTIARKARDNEITTLRVEANKTLESYVEGIEEELSKLNYRCNVEMVSAPTLVAKNIRIYEKKSDIINHFVFLESGKRSKEYEQFMQNVFSFKANGKNKHDDAPDSLAMASNMYQEILIPTVEIFDRPF